MSEKLNNHNTEAANQTANEWDQLKNIPINSKDQIANRESESSQPETELTSPTAVLDDIQKYIIRDGKVYARDTKQEELDEDTILRAKTSKFLYNEARALRDEQSQMFGDKFTDKGPDFYVDQILKRYGFTDENTQFAEGKMLKELVDSGTHHRTIGAENLSGTKYDMFIGEKGDLGQALLKRRLHQHGLEMSKFDINVDSSTFKHDGYSTVDIRLDAAPLKKTENAANGVLHHPAAEQLSNLEAGLAQARKDGDEVAIEGYLAALKMTVERHALEVTPEEWDKMDNTQRERFYQLKMKEARILGDKDSFNFWNANLQRLNNHH